MIVCEINVTAIDPFATTVKCIYLEGSEPQPRALGEIAREECVVGRQLQVVWIHLQG